MTSTSCWHPLRCSPPTPLLQCRIAWSTSSSAIPRADSIILGVRSARCCDQIAGWCLQSDVMIKLGLQAKASVEAELAGANGHAAESARAAERAAADRDTAGLELQEIRCCWFELGLGHVARVPQPRIAHGTPC